MLDSTSGARVTLQVTHYSGVVYVTQTMTEASTTAVGVGVGWDYGYSVQAAPRRKSPTRAQASAAAAYQRVVRDARRRVPEKRAPRHGYQQMARLPCYRGSRTR